MAQHYDLALKGIAGNYPEHFVRLALGPGALQAGSVDLAVLDRELPSLSREVDFLARVRLGVAAGHSQTALNQAGAGNRRQGVGTDARGPDVSAPGSTALLLVEFQTRWTADMPRRMAAYTARLHEQYREPVWPVIVVLRPGGALRSEWQMKVQSRLVLRCRFQVIALWKQDRQEAMAQGLVGLYPLLPLMRWPTTDPQIVLGQSEQLILEQIPPGKAQADAYVALRVLSGLVYPPPVVDRILQRRTLMIESPMYEVIIKEGHEMGLQKGVQQGLQQGLQQGRQADILEALEVRFGPVPEALAEQVRQVNDLARLQALFRCALVVESVDRFAQELRSTPSPQPRP